jgi:hypothetical protein
MAMPLAIALIIWIGLLPGALVALRLRRSALASAVAWTPRRHLARSYLVGNSIHPRPRPRSRLVVCVRRPMSTHDALVTESATLREGTRGGSARPGTVESAGAAAIRPPATADHSRSIRCLGARREGGGHRGRVERCIAFARRRLPQAARRRGPACRDHGVRRRHPRPRQRLAGHLDGPGDRHDRSDLQARRAV